MTEQERADQLLDARDEFKRLCETYEHGKVDPLMWSKSLIFLSTKLVHLKAVDEAHSMLALIPKDYFRTQMADQMADDPLFELAAKKLAMAFVQAGIVEELPEERDDWRPTQPPARA